MDAPAPLPELAAPALASRRSRRDRIGDTGLKWLTAGAAIFALVVIGTIVYKVVQGASLSIGHFGLPFVWHQVWDPNRDIYGALNLIYGTAIRPASRCSSPLRCRSRSGSSSASWLRAACVVSWERSSRCSRRCRAW